MTPGRTGYTFQLVPLARYADCRLEFDEGDFFICICAAVLRYTDGAHVSLRLTQQLKWFREKKVFSFFPGRLKRNSPGGVHC